MGTMMPFPPKQSTRRHPKYTTRRGMTLIELMVTVSVAGILAATATTTFNNQIHQARSTEAVEMLGSMQKAVFVASAEKMVTSDGLDFSANTFGKPPKKEKGPPAATDVDGDGDNGHGNSDGCDPSNPSGKCPGKKDKDKDDGGSDTSGGSDKVNKDADLDNDGNNGHGNNEGKCDPSNPGKGKSCDGGDDSSSGGDDGASTGDDGSSAGDDGSPAGDDGASPGDDASSGDDGSSAGDEGDGSSSGSDDSSGGATPGDGGGSLCGSADPVPSSIDMVSGKTYNAAPGAWASGDDTTGWRCLRIGRSGNQNYQFGYDVGAGTVAGASEGYTAWARGDLDGDGRTSMFRLRGELVNGDIINAPAIEVIDGHE